VWRFGAADRCGRTYDPATLTGTLTAPGTADGSLYTAADGKAIDPDLNAWLGLQMGPTEDDGITLYTPDHFTVVDNWNWIQKMTSVMKAPIWTACRSTTIPSVARRSDDSGHGPHPLAVTYDRPAAAGAVLDVPDVGLVGERVARGAHAQERVLLF